jgi:hypothetical protein
MPYNDKSSNNSHGQSDMVQLYFKGNATDRIWRSTLIGETWCSAVRIVNTQPGWGFTVSSLTRFTTPIASEGLTIACGPGSKLASSYICCPNTVLANENFALQFMVRHSGHINHPTDNSKNADMTHWNSAMTCSRVRPWYISGYIKTGRKELSRSQ